MKNDSFLSTISWMLEIKKLTKKWVTDKLPKRPKDANKGTFGKVLVIAGSKSFVGAPFFATAAAYRVGAGLVTLATIESVYNIVARKIPEATFLLLPEYKGGIGDGAYEAIVERLKEFDVLLLGPGIEQSLQTAEFVAKLLERGDLPKLVIDADGLNIISKLGNWWDKLKKDTILTPHPGEMARLTGFSVERIQSDRVNIAKSFAKKWGKVIVLKGANTVVVSPGGEVKISPFANPALSTAGTGDVLTGVIAGLSAQGLKSFDAACLGVYIHGLAGEILKEKLGDAGLLASDLLLVLPKVIQKIKMGLDN